MTFLPSVIARPWPLIMLVLLLTSCSRTSRTVSAFVPQALLRHGFSSSSSISSSSSTSVTEATSSRFISLDDALQKWKEQEDGSSNKQNSVKFVDASWYHKGPKNQGRNAFEQGPRIKGAAYFDPIEISETKVLEDDKKVGFMLPTPHRFGNAMDMLDISADTHVILYGQDIKATFLPRVWFTFWAMRHKHVSILDGTLQDWTGPMDTQGVTVPTLAVDGDDSTSMYLAERNNDGESTSLMRPDIVASQEQVLQDAEGKETIVLDARGSSFVKGHMPGAKHIPYSSLMAAKGDEGYLKDTDALQAIFKEAGVDPLTPQTIVCSCGSGVSACSIYMALMECGRGDSASGSGETLMYDGSWTEWKQLEDVPKVFPLESS